MNSFAEKFKSSTPSELLKVTEHAENYQPAAVEAARQELARRQLNEQELSEAKKELEALQLEKKKKSEAAIAFKFKKSVEGFFKKVFPKRSEPWAEKTIKLLSVFLGVTSLYALISNLDYLHYTLFERDAGLDSSIVSYFVPLLYVPVATWLFWKRKKIGWVLLSTYFIYSFISLLVNLYSYLSYPTEETGIFQLIGTVVPPPSPFPFIYYLGILSILCSPTLRSSYKVSLKYMLIIFGVAAILSCWIYYPTLQNINSY